jgi:hypothetical protein
MLTPEEKAALKKLIGSAPPGTRIELGVLRGNNLSKIAQHRGLTIGVDSFCGMPPSTDNDRKDGDDPYYEGRLACSLEDVQRNIRGIDGIQLVKGWVPEVLDKIEARDFGFAYVDLDQYESTLAALRWLETRMAPGGIICCDDWIKDRDWLAGGAINEFAKTRPLDGTCGREAWFYF